MANVGKKLSGKQVISKKFCILRFLNKFVPKDTDIVLQCRPGEGALHFKIGNPFECLDRVIVRTPRPIQTFNS
jgi:hypothetical protein